MIDFYSVFNLFNSGVAFPEILHVGAKIDAQDEGFPEDAKPCCFGSHSEGFAELSDLPEVSLTPARTYLNLTLPSR
jgi:hypothetical protein